MTWLRIDITPDQIKDGTAERLHQEVCARWEQEGKPNDAQMLSRLPTPSRRKKVALELYLSNVTGAICQDILARYSAHQIPSTPKGDLTDLLRLPHS